MEHCIGILHFLELLAVNLFIIIAFSQIDSFGLDLRDHIGMEQILEKSLLLLRDEIQECECLVSLFMY